MVAHMPASIQIERLPAALEVMRVVMVFEKEPFVILFDSAARHRTEQSATHPSCNRKRSVPAVNTCHATSKNE